MKTIAVIGFGKIGQAVAANMLLHGLHVVAVDTDTTIAGRFYENTFHTNEPGVLTVLTDACNEGNLHIEITLDDHTPDAVIICIPLAVDQEKKTIDAPFIQCFQQLVSHCSNKLLIVVETSVPVGYSRKVLLPVLESSGKKHGVDFLLSHSPERIKSGTMLTQLEKIPKVIGGISAEATEANYRLYQQFFSTELLYRVENTETAEMMKLAGMIYRDVNIALANQLAMFAQLSGIDLPSLLPLINADGEANLLQPGIGVGGHCTPVYPYFLIDNFRHAGLDFSIARAGRQINDNMAAFAVSLIRDKVRNKTALVLGLSFRPNVKEDANSVGASLYGLLEQEGFDVFMHDAEFSQPELEHKGFAFADPSKTDAEVVFLVTMHREYRQLDFTAMAANGVRFIVDGRNALDRRIVESAGISYTGIGR
ncbi:nucleotide sugar dehydrogenase [Terrimonas sp. NA20]|uniref:Nucleotide sugar dehydrogenase n=1 Tax=Terrimonas ginsenosidimutans TaxID=2908004 RepID=A0ABS9KPA6_9BACT|nr:nucleotide sugar dehydrogenase [Terrimonas ginsenosidimutans]MCG2614166.1 nucleotide sugar dehydrogenase [Terrimonas ginsenosidimutans]